VHSIGKVEKKLWTFEDECGIIKREKKCRHEGEKGL